MGHSKNDIPFEGGFARIPIKKISDKQNATFMLINPATRKPYINQEIIRDLQIRKGNTLCLLHRLIYKSNGSKIVLRKKLNPNVNSTSCGTEKAKTKPNGAWKKSAIPAFGILPASCFVPFGMRVYMMGK